MCDNCDKNISQKHKIKADLHRNREAFSKSLDENEGVVCSYLINMFHRLTGKNNITPTDGKE